jgi:RimJ/RimL family protein N-acetyltransferase
MEAITLRPTTVKDAPLLVKWYNDENNVKFMSTIVRCRKHTLKSIKKEIKDSDPDYERNFIILADNNPIGQAGIDDINKHDQRAELFILIGDKQQQGKGYGFMVLQQLLAFAFKKLKLHSLFATATIENHSSVKNLKKAGFREVGIRKEYHYLNGKFYDEVLFELLKKDYR